MFRVIEDDVSECVFHFSRRYDRVKMKSVDEDFSEILKDASEAPRDAALKTQESAFQGVVRFDFDQHVNMIRLD